MRGAGVSEVSELSEITLEDEEWGRTSRSQSSSIVSQKEVEGTKKPPKKSGSALRRGGGGGREVGGGQSEVMQGWMIVHEIIAQLRLPSYIARSPPPQRQDLQFCTSKASKLSSKTASAHRHLEEAKMQWDKRCTSKQVLLYY